MPHQDDKKSLIVTHKRRLQILEEQKALKGINTEPEILIEIENIKAELEKLQTELANSSDLVQQTIKQLVPAEPGWYLEERTNDGYDYHRVLFWVLLEETNGHETWQWLTGATRFDINDEFYFPHDDRAVYLPQLNVQYTSKKSRTMNELTLDTLWADEHTDAEAELAARIMHMIENSEHDITSDEITEKLGIREDVASYMLDWTKELIDEIRKLAKERGQSTESVINIILQKPSEKRLIE